MTPGDQTAKFIVAHEYGHAHLSQSAGIRQPSKPEHAVGPIMNSCSFGGMLYGMTTKEWSSLSNKEGWPHFVAAAVWNNRDVAGTFRLGTQTYRLIADPSQTYDSALWDCCDDFTQDCAQSLNGAATKYEWLRAVWALYADTSAGAGVSLADMTLLHRRILVDYPQMDDRDYFAYTFWAIVDMQSAGDFGPDALQTWHAAGCRFGLVYDGSIPSGAPPC